MGAALVFGGGGGVVFARSCRLGGQNVVFNRGRVPTLWNG